MHDYDAIVATISELTDLLRAANEASWVGHLDDAAARLKRPEATSREAGLDLLLSLYGGMGSLNDLVFSTYSSNLPEGYTEQRANREFRALKLRLYEQIQSAKRPHPR